MIKQSISSISPAGICHHLAKARTVATDEFDGEHPRRTASTGEGPRTSEDIRRWVPGRCSRSGRGGDISGLAIWLLICAMFMSCGDDTTATPDASESIDAPGPIDEADAPNADSEAPEALFAISEGMVWHSRRYQVVGSVNDNEAVTSVSVEVNGGQPIVVDIEPGPSIDINFELVLEPGVNALRFDVRDAADNATEVMTSIVFGARVAAAGAHSLALYVDDTEEVYGFGRNNQGQLGLPGTDPVPDGTLIPTTSRMVALAANLNHSVALDEQGMVWTWGRNNEGQLGRLDGPDSGTPTAVVGVTDIVAIAAGQRHTMALNRDGAIWAWGSNTNGQLGVETVEDTRHTPELVPGFTDEIVAIAAGGSFSLALDVEGEVWAWGNNGNGQLGILEGGERATPEKVVGVSDIVTIAAGRSHVLATTADGALYAWGLNGSGQLATGDEDDRDTPTMAVTLSAPAVTVRAAGNFSMALLETGRLLGWGQNFNGQLGNGDSGSKADTTAPVSIELSDVVDVSAGLAHTIALTADGTVFAWGLNSFGQIGNGQTGIDSSSNTPEQVPIISSGI